MGYAQKYDWDAIKADYVQGWWQTDPDTMIRKIYYPTHLELCDKYGCNEQYLRKTAAQEKWSYERRVFQAKIQEQVNDQRINLFLSESAQVDAHVLDQAKEYLKIIRRETKNIALLQKVWEVENCLADPDPDDTELNMILKARQDENGEVVAKPLQQIKAQDIMTWAKALDAIQVVARRACNEPVNADNTQYQQVVDSFRSQNNPKDSVAVKNKIKSLESRRAEILKKQRQMERSQLKELKSAEPVETIEVDAS